MLSRHFVVLILIGLSLSFAGALAQAQDKTAQQLYEQGIAEYQAEDYGAARATLRKVDPRQLADLKDREAYFKTLIEIDKKLGPAAGEAVDAAAQEPGDAEKAQPAERAEPAEEAEPAESADADAPGEAADAPPPPPAPAPAAPPTPAEYLNSAQAAAAKGDNALAADLYQTVIDHPDADAATRAAARAGLADLGRRANPTFTAAKRQFDAGAAAFDAGDYAQAKATLSAIDPADLEGQWFYIEGRKRMIEASDAAIAQAAADEVAAEKAAAAEAAEAQAAKTAAAAQAAQEAQAKADADAQAAEEAQKAQAEAQAARLAAEKAVAEEAAAKKAAEEEAQRRADLFDQARKLYAQQEVAKGIEAQNQGAHKTAVHHFSQAAELDPDNQEIQGQLAAARAAHNNQAALREPIDVVQQNWDIQRQAAITEYNTAMATARQRLDQRDYAAAIDFTEAAKTALDRNQQLFTSEGYNTRRREAEMLSEQILAQQRQADADAIARAAQENARQAQIEREEAQKRQEAEVQSLLRQAMALRREMDYDRALELVNQALFIEPNNIAAQALKEMMEDSKVLVENRRLQRQKLLEGAQLANSTVESTIPYDDLLTYPADWPQITATRLADLNDEGEESEANRRTALQLKENVPINFEGNRLVNVIDYLRNTTGANFFVNWPALEAVGIEQDAPVSLQLTNVPAEQALKLVLQQVGAVAEFDPISYSIIEGVVTISTVRDLKRTTDTRVYDIRDLLVQVPNFSNAPAFDLNEALSNTSSGGSSAESRSGGGDATGIFGEEAGALDEDTPSRSEMIEQITTLIQDTVGTPEEWVDLESSLRELNGNLIVKTTPDNHRSIIALLAQLRETRAIQIHVESRFLAVQRDFLENFNIDLDFSYIATGNFGPITLSQDSVTIADSIGTGLTPSRFTNTSGTADGQGRALDFRVSYLDDLEVDLLIQATQAHQRSLSLTAPRVTFFNGQRAYVIVARQISFVSDLEPVPDAFGFDTTLSVTQSGVVLDVEGTISADRRYVTLTLRPSLATIQEPIRTIPVNALATTTTATTTTTTATTTTTGFIISGEIEAPELELTSVRATVSIPDRGTLLIGGQRLVEEIEIEAGVPVLSKVPVLNRLFTNTTSTKDERTLLILVKPTIIIQSEQEEALFPGLLQPGQFNIGGNL